MRKHLLILLFALIVAGVFSGCGSKEPQNTQSGAGVTQAQSSQSGSSAAGGKAGTAAGGAGASTGKITGSAEDIQKMLNGIQNDNASIATADSSSSSPDNPLFNQLDGLLKDESAPSDVK